MCIFTGSKHTCAKSACWSWPPVPRAVVARLAHGFVYVLAPTAIVAWRHVHRAGTAWTLNVSVTTVILW